MKDITAALNDAVDTEVADKDGNYVERFNAEISSEKPTDSPFSLVNGKTHLAGTVVCTCILTLGLSNSMFILPLTFMSCLAESTLHNNAVRPVFGRHRHINGFH